jgi:hypothetical protein
MSIFVQIEHFHNYMYLFNCLAGIGVSNILHKSRVYWTACTLSTFKVNVLKLKYNQIM